MDRETPTLEELSDLETLLLFLRIQSRLRPHSSALPSAATRRRRRTTRIRSRRSRLARPYPPPASVPMGLLAPGLEGPAAAAAIGVDHDQTPQARHGQGQEPEFEFPMPPPQSVGHGVPSSAGGIVLSSLGGIFLPTRPPHPSPVRLRATAQGPRRAKSSCSRHSGFGLNWAGFLHLATSTPATPVNRTGSGTHELELAHHAMPNASSRASVLFAVQEVDGDNMHCS